MNTPDEKNARRVDRLQNIAIVLLTCTAVLLFASLPLFGALSDQSLLELARGGMRRETLVVTQDASVASQLTFPVRIVYTNSFARLGADSLTTLSDEFERAGTYLGEAIGSAGEPAPVNETLFLGALRGEGLYFDFTVALPTEILSDLLGVRQPDNGIETVRRMLLSPLEGKDAELYLQDGEGAAYRFSTAVSSSALLDFLASQKGSGADFAFLLGEPYARLSPYTLILSAPPPRPTLAASNALAADEETFLRRAGFNAHTENRFTESSGTVLVREVSNALYLHPDGTVDYQGAEAAPDSIYRIPALDPNAPTLSESAAAAQKLVATLTQDLLGDAALYFSDAQSDGERCEITFDLLVNGTPIRFSDGSHAAVVTTDGRSIVGFTLKARRYALTENTALLLPFPLSAAIARVWDGAELTVAYVDGGGEEAAPGWIAE